MKIAVLIYFFISTLLLARGEIKWVSMEQTHRLGANERVIEAAFPFENTGPNTIEIFEADGVCKCMSAESDKRTYAPGESGVINVHFNSDGFFGRQERTVFVTVGGDVVARHSLKLIFELEDPYSLSPRLLDWQLGATPETKVIRFKKNTRLEYAKIAIASVPEGFSAEVIEAPFDAQVLEIKVTPLDTKQPRSGRLKLNFLNNEGEMAMEKLHAVLKVR